MNLDPEYSTVSINSPAKQKNHCRKMEDDLNPRWVRPQLLDFGLYWLQLFPQCRVTAFATQSSDKR